MEYQIRTPEKIIGTFEAQTIHFYKGVIVQWIRTDTFGEKPCTVITLSDNQKIKIESEGVSINIKLETQR